MKWKPLASNHEKGATVRYAGSPPDEGTVVEFSHYGSRRLEHVAFGGRRGTEIHDPTHLIEIVDGEEIETRHMAVWPG